MSVLLSRAIRHLYLYLEGDVSEDHLGHAMWNVGAMIHFEENMPEMVDIPARRAAWDRGPKSGSRKRKRKRKKT